MNILIIGSGAREHAIVAALHRSAEQPQLFCCGSSLNPGIQQMSVAYCKANLTDPEAIVAMAKQWEIELVIIGPEAPLEAGVADVLWAAAIPVIGPKQQLAQIETSKAFARHLMQKNNIPGLPRYQVFQQSTGVEAFLRELGDGHYVVKANGLMGGKGVKVAGEHLHSIAEALAYCDEIFTQNHTVVIEEKLIGQEFSFMCFCDGVHLVGMPLVQDHKRAFIGDQGPNTGGMGSYSDANHRLPFLTEADQAAAWEINQAVYKALMAECQEKYIGVLYGSFIATRHGVYVIEFNARFGDPEALNVLTILESDFVAICKAWVTEKLTSDLVRFTPQASVCKYAVPEGYPTVSSQQAPINISAVKDKARLYLAAVDAVNGTIYTTGSRTAAYVGVAHSISAAEAIAEKEIGSIDGPLFHREDIGTERLIQYRVDEMRRLRA